MASRRITQAVIFIHGIGEQKPMDTLRNFVDAVLPESESGLKYFSKPDRMSESFELRKLQGRSQPRTHFFEYYWAHKVKGTTIRHVLSWFFSLLLRWPWHVPKHLKALWWLSWVLAAAFIVSLVYGFLSDNLDFGDSTLPFSISGVSAVVLTIMQSTVIRSVGDAARYLHPHPSNVMLRHAIRSDGIKLLRNIHESGKYERVVVVGHSLGSVIGYDILKHLWEEYYRTYQKPREHQQTALSRMEDAGELLSKSANPDEISSYQKKQLEVWKELRDLGHPWLVTDFITLGSPLVHAALLLAQSEEDLVTRQYQRELPTSPPIPEITKEGGEKKERYSYRIWEPFSVDNKKIYLRALHHAAVFGCTRWTNLYFPTRLAVFGDFVGGSLTKWFGQGIRDIPVTSTRWRCLAKFTPAAHSSYWWAPPVDWREKGDQGTFSLAELVLALDLEGKHWLPLDIEAN